MLSIHRFTLLAGLAFGALVSSPASHAERMFIDTNKQGDVSHWVYTETLVIYKDNTASALVGHEDLNTQKEDRARYGVTWKDCNAKYGSYYVWDTNRDRWQELGQWSNTGQTIGDKVAIKLCLVYFLKKIKLEHKDTSDVTSNDIDRAMGNAKTSANQGI